MRVDQVGEGGCVEQRDVAGDDHHGAVEVVGQRGQPASDGMAGAQLLVLHGDVDAAAQSVGERVDGGRHQLAVLTDHHDDVLRGDLGDGVQGVRQNAAARQRVQHLGGVRPHPGTGSGGHDDHRGLASCGHPTCLPTLSGLLRRQDSNLNYLNQNQRCCRLHHDGLSV